MRSRSSAFGFSRLRSLPATANRDVDLNEASSTLVRVNVYIFSFLEFRTRFFFTSSFFKSLFLEKKWTLGARPVGKMSAKFCLFMSRCSVFFFHFSTFLREKSETNTFHWKHLLKSSGQELKRKSSLARFKVTPFIFSLYVWLLDESPAGNPTVHYFDWNRSCTLKVSM